MLGGDMGDLPEDLPEDTQWQQVLHWWEQLLDLAYQYLEDADTAMVWAYKRKVAPLRIDMRKEYTEGCLVLMKQKQPGKSKLRATGSYRFEDYRGAQGTGADITAPDGTVSRVSVANLVPYRGNLNWPRHAATA